MGNSARELLRALKNMGEDEFESLVNQYLCARYPSLEIKKVDGSGGDEGIDSFKGMLRAGPKIWQSKYFPDRIRDSQQSQIRKSIKAASAFKSEFWTLCVPIDLRTEEHRWFQKSIVSKYGGPDRVKLIQAHDLLGELEHNRSLRDMFFPENSISRAMDVRKILTGTEKKTEEELNAAIVELAQQYLEGNTEVEPRLRAVLSVGGQPDMRRQRNGSGLVMSIERGEETISYYARNPKDFNLDPIRLGIRMSSEYRQPFNLALDKGRTFKIPAGALTEVNSSSPLLSSLFESTKVSGIEMRLIPQLPAELSTRIFPLRLIAGRDDSAKIFSYVPFQITRLGRQEVEFTSKDFPAGVISLVLSPFPPQSSSFEFEPKLTGVAASTLNTFLEFIEELGRSSELLIDSVELDIPLLRASGINFDSRLGTEGLQREIIANAAIVSKTFAKPLIIPEAFREEDVTLLTALKRIATGEEFVDFDWEATAIKSPDQVESVLQCLHLLDFVLQVEHPAGCQTVDIFGVPIDPGPHRLTAKGSSFSAPEEFRKAYLEAEEGAAVPIRGHSNGPCSFVREPSGTRISVKIGNIAV